MRTSYSSLDTYKTCPLKYKFQEIDKIKAPKGVEAVFGSAVHASLKYMFERTPLYPTIDQVLDFFRDCWNGQKDSAYFDMDVVDEEQIKKVLDAYCQDGINLLEKFYKKNPAWNFNAVELESFFSIEIEDEATKEKHTIAGKIDRIDKNDDDTYEIIDYKTGKRMPSQQMIDDDLQLSVYHLALAKKWPHIKPEKIKLSLYYLKHNEKIATGRSAGQLENTKNSICGIIREIGERTKNNYDFPAMPNALCDYCGYRQMCPMYKHLYAAKYEREKIQGQEELEKIMAEFFALKDQNSTNNKRLGELKAKVSNFMDDQKVSRVFSDLGYITKKTQEKVSYDMEKVREILAPLGKWDDIQDPCEKKLEALLPHLSPAEAEKIKSLRSLRKTFTITATKKKGGDDEEEDG